MFDELEPIEVVQMLHEFQHQFSPVGGIIRTCMPVDSLQRRTIDVGSIDDIVEQPLEYLESLG